MQLPGSTFHAPGTKVPSVAVPGDPALVSPVSIVDSEHSSRKVFILPVVLFVLLVLLLGGLALRRRNMAGGTAGTGGPATPTPQ